MYNLICRGKEHKGFWIPKDYTKVGAYSDQYAVYTIYQNSQDEILYTRYCDMD